MVDVIPSLGGLLYLCGIILPAKVQHCPPSDSVSYQVMPRQSSVAPMFTVRLSTASSLLSGSEDAVSSLTAR